jgi:hypothetical protein
VDTLDFKEQSGKRAGNPPIQKLGQQTAATLYINTTPDVSRSIRCTGHSLIDSERLDNWLRSIANAWFFFSDLEATDNSPAGLLMAMRSRSL